MVQMMQFLHMQGDPFHFLSNVLNSEIFSIVLITNERICGTQRYSDILCGTL